MFCLRYVMMDGYMLSFRTHKNGQCCDYRTQQLTVKDANVKVGRTAYVCNNWIIFVVAKIYCMQ